MRPELVAFYGSQFSGTSELLNPASTPTARRCGRTEPAVAECVILQWLRQVQTLATEVGRLAGERTSVHMLTACLDPRAGDALNRAAGPSAAPVIVHPGHAAELREVVAPLRRKPCVGCHHGEGWGDSYKFPTLLKWQIVSHEGSQLVAFMDLDIEVCCLCAAHRQGHTQCTTPT